MSEEPPRRFPVTPPPPPGEPARPPGGPPDLPAPETRPTDRGEAFVPDGPLPVCDYTAEGDEPCEEPARARRWSGASVVFAAVFGAVFGGLLTAALAAWLLGLVPGTKPIARTAVAPSVSATGQASIEIVTKGTVDTAVAVARKATPWVVNITIQQETFQPFSGTTGLRAAGNGSGVVIRADGYILTNYHVVESADALRVKVGVEDLPATVVGVDPSTDLAVIKVAKTGLPTADIGDSRNLQVGQFVVAVGSPFGLEKSVTSGIISALGRSNLAEQGTGSLTQYTNLIQTDAPINPGNSGGALVNENGELIGINTLIQSTSGSSAGIGFAIPIDFANSVAKQLIETGRAIHPYMGVQTISVSGATASQLGLPVEHGAYVDFVEPGSPADKAGVRRGDILVRIGTHEVESNQDVFAAVRSSSVGSTLEVVLVRGEQEKTLEVVLGSDAARR